MLCRGKIGVPFKHVKFESGVATIGDFSYTDEVLLHLLFVSTDLVGSFQISQRPCH